MASMIKVTLTMASLSLLACSSAAPSSGVSAPEPDPGALVTAAPGEIAGGGEGIVKIQTRDRSVTLLSAEHGVRRFTVEDEHGRVIARRVDLTALEAIDARAFDLVKSTVATGTAQGPLGN